MDQMVTNQAHIHIHHWFTFLFFLSTMGSSKRGITELPSETTFLSLLLLMFLLSTSKTSADTMVTGSVFCDQCRDGKRSIIDYPLFGATVGVECAGSDGQMVTYKEQTTNWFGTYGIRFSGSPDLTKCKARVIGGPTVCPNVTGSVQDLKLLFQLFDTELYTVDPLLAQPDKPIIFCQVLPPTSPTPSPTPSVLPPPPPPVIPLPPPAVIPPLPPIWNTPPLPPSVMSPPPSFIPPLPPVWHPPPLPFLKPSACSHLKWIMPEYRCHWKVVNPKTTVAGALGKLAGERFGKDITLWQSLHGKGEVHRALLREGTTALLNSYHSLRFFYPTLVVVELMNRALVESPHEALTTALSFRKANSGDPQYGGASCDFDACH